MTQYIRFPSFTSSAFTTDVNITEVGGAPIALGQTVMASSFPVVIASDQSAIPVSNASIGATGAAVPASATYVGFRSSAGSLVSVQLTAANNFPVDVQASALPTGAATQTTLAALNTKTAGSLVPVAFDEVDLTYVPSGAGAGQIAMAVYKLASSTVKTLTMSYDGSDRLSSVVAS